MTIIGLTGGMGCGKSTVSAILAGSFHIVDADRLTRIVHRSPAICAKLAKAFGPEVVEYTPDPVINRPILARCAFACEQNRHALNAIMQPALYEAAKNEIASASGHCILDAPLLFEAGWDELTDKSVVILCPEHVRIQRIIQRDHLDIDHIQARLRAQVDDEERCRKADYFIYNTANLDVLERQIRRIFAQWME